ncbi:glutathione S-transferase T3 [Medicago truncatula]|uniref:DNA-binding protein, putative n=1 Tax=Medicago truncatula TaxID=3880 RepID=G7JA24_MEDTR|nr:glutathione S-transferase T3 [Medicago truncatula]AES71048.1 DNA-binding protein, putative [Medicago truncatula]
MSHELQIGNSGVQSYDQETPTPKSCTQGGLETINLDQETGSAPAINTPKIRFQPNEDERLIQSWFNISKDSIVGIDQKGDSFWKKISEAYNNHYDKNCQERNFMALKGRWHKTINPYVPKFVGCYKQAVGLKKSGSSESDIISAAHDVFHHDMHIKFTFEGARRLMKDDPKWSA